jgi:molybdate transport system substrate-binding protein
MRRTARLFPALAILTVAAASLTGCGGSSDTAASGGFTSPTAGALKGTVNVFAASSLQEAFSTLGKQFEAAHPGTKIVFNFGPSSGLAEQITQGSPADVFASASAKNMDQVVTAGDAATSTPFVKNVMEIAVPPDNPAKVTGVNDLAKKKVKVALCQAVVPCGATAAMVFANAKITVTPVTEEVDVKSVLAKVQLDEVDAGVVYVTDVRASGEKVKGIEIPADVNASTTYPIATLTKAPNKATAKAFTDYVLSPAGAAVLAAAGFQKP